MLDEIAKSADREQQWFAIRQIFLLLVTEGMRDVDRGRIIAANRNFRDELEWCVGVYKAVRKHWVRL